MELPGEIVHKIGEQVTRAVRDALDGVREELSQKIEGVERELSDKLLKDEALLGLVAGAPEAGEPGDVEGLFAAIGALDVASSQKEILRALLERAQRGGGRAAFWVVKDSLFHGWASSGFGSDSESLNQVRLPTRPEGPWQRLLDGEGAIALAPVDAAEICSAVESPLPHEAFAIPMVLRNRVAGALYVDRFESDPALDPAALQVLTYAAGLAVETLELRRGKASASLRRAAATPPPPVAPEIEPAEPPETAPEVEPVAEEPAGSEPAAELSPSATQAVDLEPSPLPEAAPEIAPEPEPEIASEPEVATVEEEEAPVAHLEEIEVESSEEPTPASAPLPAGNETMLIPTDIASYQPAPEVDALEDTRAAEEISAPVEEADEALADETYPVPDSPSADAGDDDAAEPDAEGPSARGSMVLPPEDLQGPGTAFADRPESIAPADQAAHEEGRRLARLLVSEIRLYNEEQVEAGRRHGDLYERLREDIERSRRMYDERISAEIRAARDYFQEELVRILAEGDPDLLGV